MILQTLFQQCVKRDVTFFNEFQVLDIAFADDDGPAGRRVAGVVAYELATGDLHVFTTKAVLFASGGFGRMFKITSNAVASPATAPALLYRRGIPMQDMEFFQFHPTGIYKLGILLSEAARGEGGILRNADGERFMERYAPTVKDLAPRDMVSRSIMTEIREGRGAGPDKDMVYLDLTHLPPEQIDEKLPDITDFVRTYLGIEPKKDPIPIQPTAHYAMGGIPTNVDGQVVIDADNTVLPGLYAAGECACVSVHGANRLGTNSLLDIVVFGRRGGRDMAGFVNDGRPARAARGPRGRRQGPHRADEGRHRRREHRRPPLRAPGGDDGQRHGLPDRGEPGPRHRRRRRPDRRATRTVKIDDKGEVFNYDLTEALELGYLIELAKVTWPAPGPAPRAGAPTSGTTTRSARTSTG